MSNLSQFFGGGSGGSSIPAKILLTDGGSGASATVDYNAVGSPYVNYNCAGAAGGFVMLTPLCLEPGASCPITVGAGGANYECTYYFFMPLQPMYQYLCYGKTGGSTRFGSIGTEDNDPLVCNYIPCSPTPVICVPRYPSITVETKTLLSTSSSANYSSYPLDGCAQAGAQLCCICFGAPGALSYVRTGNMKSSCTDGLLESDSKLRSLYTMCTTGALCSVGVQNAPNLGLLSDITGSLRMYGASAISPGCPYSSVPFNCSCCFETLTTGYIYDPNRRFEGSGAGSHWHCCWPAGGGGCPGIVVVQYPTEYNAATVSSPKVCDCSPQTPGCRTYAFYCPGSITLPS